MSTVRAVRWLLLLTVLSYAQEVYKAQMLEQAGQFEPAFALYRQGFEKNPRDRQALAGLVRLGGQLGRYDTVLAVLQRAEAAVGENPDVALAMIEALCGLKRAGAARERAARFYRRWDNRVLELVEVLYRGKEVNLAAQFLEQTIKSRGFRIDYGEKLVELYDALARPKRATAVMVEIVNAEPRRLERFFDRLRSYGKRPGPKEIVGELERIQEPHRRARAQAEVYLGAGDEVEAVRVVRRVLGTEELKVFARECENRGAWRAALTLFQELGLNPDAARVLRRMGRVDQALALLARDSSGAGRLELADILRLERRDFRGARAAYEEVLRKDPRDRRALLGSAAALLGLRQLDSARQVLRALDTPGDSGLFLLAKVFFYAGEFDSVVRVVQDLNVRFPQSLVANDALELGFLALEKQGGPELAAALLDYETGADAECERRARALSRGEDRVAQQAFFLLSRLFFRQGRYQAAVAVLDTFAHRFPRSELVPRALLEQAAIYRQGLKDEARCRAALERVLVEFSSSAYAPLARNLLREAGGEFAPGEVR